MRVRPRAARSRRAVAGARTARDRVSGHGARGSARSSLEHGRQCADVRPCAPCVRAADGGSAEPRVSPSRRGSLAARAMFCAASGTAAMRASHPVRLCPASACAAHHDNAIFCGEIDSEEPLPALRAGGATGETGRGVAALPSTPMARRACGRTLRRARGGGPDAKEASCTAAARGGQRSGGGRVGVRRWRSSCRTGCRW